MCAALFFLNIYVSILLPATLILCGGHPFPTNPVLGLLQLTHSINQRVCENLMSFTLYYVIRYKGMEMHRVIFYPGFLTVKLRM